MKSTTALLRTIDEQDEARRQEAWEDRRRSHAKRPPKWAVDHFLEVGAISAEQHDSALRYARAIEAGFAGDPLSSGLSETHVTRVVWDTSVAAEFDRVAKALDRAQSREVAVTARSHVRNALLRWRKTAWPTMDLLFGFNGLFVTGPLASWKMLRSRGTGVTNAQQCEAQTVRVLAALDEHFTSLDHAYGR